MRRRSLGQKSSSSEDEFEKEMASELDATVKKIEQKQQIGVYWYLIWKYMYDCMYRYFLFNSCGYY